MPVEPTQLSIAAAEAKASRIPDPLSLTAEQYGAACVAAGISGKRLGALARYANIYRAGVLDDPLCPVLLPPVGRVMESDSPEGKVVKFTLKVPGREGQPDGLETESVIIPMIGKRGIRTHTLCVSSQVGCAMGCNFCQTAQMGLLRNLTVREIIAQWFAARHIFKAVNLGNVVFMGMGEPMDNLENVIGAIAILGDHRGPALARNRVTVSTVGRVDGIARLARQVHQPGWHRLSLAVSLNAPNDQVRSAIMPINRAMPMGRLREAIENWPIYGGAKICLEYVLIPGVNDAPEHAAQLGDFVLGRGEYAGRPALPGLVNVIPYNPRDNSPWPAPTEDAVGRFMLHLGEQGVYAKRRRTKGRDTMAACGQLGNPALRRRPATGVQVTASARE